MADIPEVFNHPGAGFVTLPAGIKFPPPYKEWQLPENARSFQQAQDHAAKGGNVGILAGNGYVGLDKDDPTAFEGLELPTNTTLWETRPGRLGLRFVVSDDVPAALATIGKKADLAQLSLYKDGKHCGEIKLQRQYQVIPPSWKKLEDGTRADYKMLDSSPPATISLTKLLADLQAIGITFTSKLEQNTARLESMATKAHQRRAESDESRTRRYAEAALRDEVLTLAGTPEGTRNVQLNDSAFNLGQFVAVGLLSEDEVISELTRAAENTGLDSDAIRKTIISGFEAGKQHPREMPRAEETPTPENINDLFTNDPKGSIKNTSFLRALAILRETDPIEYDLLKGKIASNKSLKGISKKTIDEIVERHVPKAEEADEAGPEIPEDILTEANQIFDEGRGFEYAYAVWQKRHHGDANLGRGLLLSLGAQSCLSSKGVHIHACGPRGSGKSDGAEKGAEEIPAEYLLVGSASPKALYYLGERLPAGAVVYLDDIGWNDQAAQMFKTCTTFYREGATHTVVVDQEIRQFKTAPRIIFWLTTADDQTDEQIRDRLLRIDTTETATHTKAVIDFIFSQRKSGAASFDPRELEVCRAIVHPLKQVFIDVVIPFSDKIRFEGDPRGATIFADLVSSFAVWRHRIRAHDSNGAIIASYEDYKDAETFFNAIKGHGDTKYTPRELKVLQAIKDHHGVATREMVSKKTGLSKGDLSDILNGRSRDGQAKYGLFHKCAALTEDEEGTSIQIEDVKKTRTSVKKKILRLPPDYDTLSTYGKAVYLADETTIKRTCSASSEQFGTGSEIKNEFGKDLVRKFVEYNIIREKRTNEHKLSPCVDGINLEKLSFSRQEQKTTEPANSKPLDSGLLFRTETEPCRTVPNWSEDSDLPTMSKIDRPTPTKPRLTCAKCGADLTGHSSLERDGKVYCARPGCGYPKCEKVEAT